MENLKQDHVHRILNSHYCTDCHKNKYFIYQFNANEIQIKYASIVFCTKILQFFRVHILYSNHRESTDNSNWSIWQLSSFEWGRGVV